MCLIPWPQNPVAYRLLDSYLGVPLSRENRRLNILIMHKYSIVFKCRNGLAPPYLIDSFNANTFNHSNSTRNSSKLRIAIARTEYYHRRFLIFGCNAWNNLPDYMQNSISLNIFKFNMFKYHEYLLAKAQNAQF